MSEHTTNPTRSDIFDCQFELMKTELSFCNSAIRQHDEITKSIKSWSIVTWTGSVGLAMSTTDLKPYIMLTAVVPLVFWIVDASFRRIQRSFIVRISEISKYINSDAFAQAAISHSRLGFELLTMRTRRPLLASGLKYWRKNSFFGVMLFRSVSLLYIGLMTISIVTWYLIEYLPGSGEVR